MIEDDWSDFTETAFRGHIQALKAGGYRFIAFGQQVEGRQVLWRHDVDFSVHRAARMAQVEAEEGVRATYFVNARSDFYNLAEPAVAALARRIRDLGHDVGMHFDSDAYGAEAWTIERLEWAVDRERTLLELLLDTPIRAMSWHNPTLSNVLQFEAEELCGLVNAYSAHYRDDFVYASDSNGYWRFKPMAEVIAEGHERLHLLTHCGWWTPEALSPAGRVRRCIDGRAKAVWDAYAGVLRRSGRRNVGVEADTPSEPESTP